MPGWIGRLQQASSARGGGRLWSPGRLCKVQACVTRQQAAEDWRNGVPAAVQELAAGIAAAGLEAGDVAACKVYCLAALLEQHDLTAAALQEAVEAALPGVQPVVVPASALSGGSPDAECGLVLEVLAVKS